MSALRKPEICACPYCGQAMEGDDAALRTLRLPRKRRILLDALRNSGGRALSSTRLESEMWGDEIDGGPDSTLDILYHHVSKLRVELRPLGYRIENERNLGYRLVRAEAAQ